MNFAQSRKAWLGALVAFLTPILTYVAATGEWSWRAFAGTVVSGLITGLTVYQVPNAPPARVDARLHGMHRADGNPSVEEQ
jgi:hypothetical protein